MRVGQAALLACAQMIVGACRTVTLEDGSATGGGGATSSHASSTHVTTAVASSSGSGGSGGSASFTGVEFSGALIATPSQVYVMGAEVCVLDHPEAPCVTSDELGAVDLLIPISDNTGITIVKPTLAKLLFPLATNQRDQIGWLIGVPSEATIGAFYGAASVTYPDASQGFLTVFTTFGNGQEGKAGVVVSLAAPATGAPLYANDAGAYDAALTATSSLGVTRFAIPPGEVEVDVENPHCTPNFGGWFATQSSAVRVPVRAGFMTHVGFSCP